MHLLPIDNLLPYGIFFVNLSLSNPTMSLVYDSGRKIVAIRRKPLFAESFSALPI